VMLMLPLEDVETVVGSSHFKSAEGQTAQQENVLQVLLTHKTDLVPIFELRQALDQLAGHHPVSEGHAGHKPNQLLPEGVFYELPLLFFSDDGPFSGDLLIIEEDDCLAGAQVYYYSHPLLCLDVLLLDHSLAGGLILDGDSLAYFDHNTFSVGFHPADDRIFPWFFHEVEREDNGDFLGGGEGTCLSLTRISSKEWIVDTSVQP
jgi:hypothetical protein